MPDFILLMQGDTTGPEGDWDAYLAQLGAKGRLRGGSAIGNGRSYRKSRAPTAPSTGLTGFVRIDAADLDDAATLLAGNRCSRPAALSKCANFPPIRA